MMMATDKKKIQEQRSTDGHFRPAGTTYVENKHPIYIDETNNTTG